MSDIMSLVYFHVSFSPAYVSRCSVERCIGIGIAFSSLTMILTIVSEMLQIIEVLLVSLITSLLSFGLPMMTSCKPCPDPVKYPGIVCPRPSGNYGNYVNVSLCEDLLFYLNMVFCGAWFSRATLIFARSRHMITGPQCGQIIPFAKFNCVFSW